MQVSTTAKPCSRGAKSTPGMSVATQGCCKTLSVEERRQSWSMLISASMKTESHCLNFISGENMISFLWIQWIFKNIYKDKYIFTCCVKVCSWLLMDYKQSCVQQENYWCLLLSEQWYKGKQNSEKNVNGCSDKMVYTLIYKVKLNHSAFSTSDDSRLGNTWVLVFCLIMPTIIRPYLTAVLWTRDCRTWDTVNYHAPKWHQHAGNSAFQPHRYSPFLPPPPAI